MQERVVLLCLSFNPSKGSEYLRPLHKRVLQPGQQPTNKKQKQHFSSVFKDFH